MHLNNFEATARGARWLNAIGRLAPGVSLDQAQAEMQAINARLAREYPQENAAVTINLGPLREEIVGNIRPLLLVLFGAVTFVLLIACANVRQLDDEPVH